MTVTCPNGHQSETTDYCDQCGARIDGVAAPPVPPASAPGPATAPEAASAFGPAAPPTIGGPTPLRSAPGMIAALDPSATPAPDPVAADPAILTGASGEASCPLCQTSRIGDDRFCEGCGYDYTTAPSPGQPATTPSWISSPVAAAWEAIAVADRGYFDRVAPEGVTFPLHCPPRTYLLAGEQLRVGRRSNSRGIQPEVDLSGAPEDAAISHLHCLLLQQPDGTYCVVDPGSTNGTTMNDDPTPLMANIAVALADGDRLHLGAWTTITVRARRPDRPGTAP